MDNYKELVKIAKSFNEKDLEKDRKSESKKFEKEFGVKNGKFSIKLEKNAPVHQKKK